MRSFLGGLLGLCLGLALLPDVASARTDARSSVQNASSSRAVTASRPAMNRPASSRASASTTREATTRQAATRQVSTRPATTRQVSTRQASVSRATAARSTSANRYVARGGSTRHAAAIPYARQPAIQAPRGLRQTAMASCTTRNGRRVCAPGATRTASMRWTGGLAPAAMSQAGCPDGTIATMALGHNDITRCVPL